MSPDTKSLFIQRQNVTLKEQGQRTMYFEGRMGQYQFHILGVIHNNPEAANLIQRISSQMDLTKSVFIIEGATSDTLSGEKSLPEIQTALDIANQHQIPIIDPIFGITPVVSKALEIFNKNRATRGVSALTEDVATGYQALEFGMQMGLLSLNSGLLQATPEDLQLIKESIRLEVDIPTLGRIIGEAFLEYNQDPNKFKEYSDTVIRGANYISAQAFQYLFNKLRIDHPDVAEILMCVGNLHLEIFSILSGETPIPREWIVTEDALEQAIDKRNKRQTRRITW